MTKKIPLKKVMDLGNRQTLAKEARKSVNLCHRHGRYVAVLCLIACVIDAFADGNKKNYLRLLEQHFPDLCKELGAHAFYKMYRNGIVHNFRPKRGFALCEANEVGPRYIDEVIVRGKNKPLTGLNMDRFAKEFVRLCQKIIAENRIS